MIDRHQYTAALNRALKNNPVVSLLGPRQCGKTTLAHQVGDPVQAHYFDLEHPRDRARLDPPMITLEQLNGLVIIDEIQRKPELFESLRVLVDRPDCRAKFLLLGSASPGIVRGASESLAGRVGFVDLSGFDLREVGVDRFRELWLRGGFPRSFLAGDQDAAAAWLDDFIRTFLERDIAQFGITIAAETLRRFWTMVAHYHAQVWNASEFARSLGSTQPTARRYLDLLSGAYMARQIQPWFENLKKRQVKSPKVYIRDSGVLHTLLAIDSFDALHGHPKLGASWEGFVVEQIIACAQSRDVYFWSTHSGAELDLLVFKSGKRIGFEIKNTDAPRTTKSMRVSISDLGLDRLLVVYPGAESYPLDKGIEALAIHDLPRIFIDPPRNTP
jgi:predicted AAA+ superfamily ATPase